jgi:GNAT superfamily N-acetyltransferase
MKDQEVVIELHSSEEARTLMTTVGDLYSAVFSLPPFLGNQDEFKNQRSYYMDMTLNTGFRLATAKRDDQYVGFAYGYLLRPDTGWWNGVSAALPDEFIRETGSRTFAIIDFGVLPGYRAAGVGKALHDAILSASGAERATLTVQAKAVATQSIYRHWGWRQIGQRSGNLGGVPVTFDVYVIDISN